MLWKSEVRICGNFQKKQSKIRHIWQKLKRRLLLLYMAEYCDDSFLKCPPFLAKTSMPLVSYTVSDGLVNAVPNMQKTLLQFTTLV